MAKTWKRPGYCVTLAVDLLLAPALAREKEPVTAAAARASRQGYGIDHGHQAGHLGGTRRAARAAWGGACRGSRRDGHARAVYIPFPAAGVLARGPARSDPVSPGR